LKVLEDSHADSRNSLKYEYLRIDTDSSVCQNSRGMLDLEQIAARLRALRGQRHLGPWQAVKAIQRFATEHGYNESITFETLKAWEAAEQHPHEGKLALVAAFYGVCRDTLEVAAPIEGQPLRDEKSLGIVADTPSFVNPQDRESESALPEKVRYLCDLVVAASRLHIADVDDLCNRVTATVTGFLDDHTNHAPKPERLSDGGR
jgi:hypothetical protein